jgi:hypothetical protein
MIQHGIRYHNRRLQPGQRISHWRAGSRVLWNDPIGGIYLHPADADDDE